MSATKPPLARDNTMKATAKEGVAYLKSEGKQSLLVEQGLVKPTLARDSTMVNTAKEAASILGDKKPDADAQTRGQNKKIAELTSEPPAKKAKKATTIGNKPGMKKLSSIAKTIQESKHIMGDSKLGDVSQGRQLRKRANAPPQKPSLKKAGTMEATAKEGKEFLKRGRKPAAKKEPEKIDEEDEEDAE
ncbi:uncharacterized protein LOC141908907 [Tubulanus polymorphus]|uniref:uncharacterized protein LOC141908907 n=1 Tax=Tubulanus polymorphus TaxID=672921 RepID=UPI003DA66B81